MCNFKSGIILKNRVVLAPEENESHSSLLESLNIEDNHMNASKIFVRAELIPKDGNKATEVSTWKYKVDQDIVPDWYEVDPERYEQEFRKAVTEYMKDKITVICGRAWTAIKTDDKGTYYMLDGLLKNMSFGNNNNYSESDIREELNNSKLLQELKNEFGDRLVPIKTDLTSMDGFKDYGSVEGDLLAIPTFDLYRECGEKIPLANNWYWLATPNQTPSRKDSRYVRCVSLDSELQRLQLERQWGSPVLDRKTKESKRNTEIRVPISKEQATFLVSQETG